MDKTWKETPQTPKETAPSATLFGRPDGVGGLRDLARASAEAGITGLYLLKRKKIAKDIL